MTTPAKPARISDRDPYVRPEWLPPGGAAYTIHAWMDETVRQPSGQSRSMPCLVFTNGKRLLVNITNLRKLAQLFHDSEEESIGKSIVLKPAITSGKPTVLVDRLIERKPAGEPNHQEPAK